MLFQNDDSLKANVKTVETPSKLAARERKEGKARRIFCVLCVLLAPIRGFERSYRGIEPMICADG